MTMALLFNVLVMVVAQMRMQGCEGCIPKERMGLLEIKTFLSQGTVLGYVQSELASWVDNGSSNCCAWNRVKCSNSTGHVTEVSLSNLANSQLLNVSLFRPFEELLSLDLSSNGYEGWIHNEGFPSLKKLQTLILSDNSLNFSILSSLSALTSLETLKLDRNGIEGSFSAQDFVHLSSLKALDLSYNVLNSSLDGQDFASVKNLEMLDLSYNYLMGGDLLFSKGILGLSIMGNLKFLDLGSNKLNGSLQMQGLCELKNLVELDLSWNKLSGQLPECLSNLTNLQVLDLTNNLLSGSFPSFISNLTSLEYLSLFQTYIEGSFSLSILSNHSKLQVLHFPSQSNKLSVQTEEDIQWYPTFQLKSLILQRCNLNVNRGSTIPSFLLHQHDLQYFDLSHNNMIGTFPSWLLQNNSRLEDFFMRNNSFVGNLQLPSFKHGIGHFDVSNNRISGLLPENIGLVLPNITYMNLSMNSFEGNIPSSIGEMKGLWVLDISYNHFSGELPKQFAANCNSLMLLKLSNNFFNGTMDLKSSNWTQLEWLYLNNNNFSGRIEDVLANNTHLSVVDISNNSISGTIPSSIGSYSSLKILTMADNQIQGEIPIGLSTITNLEILDLSQNKLSGPLPYLNLPFLRFLYLQKNALSGSIPSTLATSSQLVALDLRDNQFSGSIPHWIDKLSELRVLLLGGNNVQGPIPIQLCHMKNVSIMDLSRNKLSGSIPSCLTNLSFGMVSDEDYGKGFEVSNISIILGDGYMENFYPNTTLKLDQPNIISMLGNEVQVEVEFRTKSNYYFYEGNILEHMTGLDLSCNELTGIIPSQIGDLQQIYSMNLSHNFLSGPIPNSFSNLVQIESLDLSYNNLSGEIPIELSQLHSLAIFNVSYNNLSGIPPSTGQFANFDEDNYRGNPNLCGTILNRSCEGTLSSPLSQSNEEEEDAAVDMVAFYWSFIGSYITILLGLVSVLCINAQWRFIWFRFIDKFVCSFSKHS